MPKLSTGAKVGIAVGVGVVVVGGVAVALMGVGGSAQPLPPDPKPPDPKPPNPKPPNPKPKPAPTLDDPCPGGTCTYAHVGQWVHALADEIDAALNRYNSRGWAEVNPLPPAVAAAVEKFNAAADVYDQYKDGALGGDLAAQVQALAKATAACVEAGNVFMQALPDSPAPVTLDQLPDVPLVETLDFNQVRVEVRADPSVGSDPAPLVLFVAGARGEDPPDFSKKLGHGLGVRVATVSGLYERTFAPGTDQHQLEKKAAVGAAIAALMLIKLALTNRYATTRVIAMNPGTRHSDDPFFLQEEGWIVYQLGLSNLVDGVALLPAHVIAPTQQQIELLGGLPAQDVVAAPLIAVILHRPDSGLNPEAWVQEKAFESYPPSGRRAAWIMELGDSVPGAMIPNDPRLHNLATAALVDLLKP